MKTLKVPRKSSREGAARLPALLLLGVRSGSALAATEIESPCPEVSRSPDDLQSFIVGDAATIARTVDATETLSSKPLADNALDQAPADAEDTPVADDSEVEEVANPRLTSRLPGVSVNDLPGFRRHMYRTDI